MRVKIVKQSVFMKSIFFFGVALMFLRCGGDSTVAQKTDTTAPRKTEIADNKYYDMRALVLSLQADDLGLVLTDSSEVYGVIMDWSIDDTTVATIVAFKTGDASLYMSSGAAVIGGGQHELVNLSAKQHVQVANSYLDKARLTENTSPPLRDTVRFYLLTERGIFMLQDRASVMESDQSQIQGLFTSGNELMTELRLVADKD